MNLINLDLSNIKIDNTTTYDSSLILKMIEKENILCFFKGNTNNGIGVRIIEDNTTHNKYSIEFLESIDLNNTTLYSVCGSINKGNDSNKIKFYQVEI